MSLAKPKPMLVELSARAASRQEALMWWTIGVNQSKGHRKKERPEKGNRRLTEAYNRGKAGKAFVG